MSDDVIQATCHPSPLATPLLCPTFGHLLEGLVIVGEVGVGPVHWVGVQPLEPVAADFQAWHGQSPLDALPLHVCVCV